MGTKFTLKSPITLQDGTTVITEMELNEPTAGMMEMAEQQGKTSSGMNIVLIGLCAGQHPQVIRQLTLKDYAPMVKWVESFLGGFLGTGEN